MHASRQLRSAGAGHRAVPRVWRDRAEAGRALAAALAPLRGRDPVVLGLPRGGVPVAAEVARALGAPLDVLVVRKLGVPWHEELAMGAIASGGALVLDDDLIRALRLSREDVDEVVRRERAELARRERLFRGGRPPLRLAGRTVVLVDDGLATGSTMAAAAQALRHHGVGRLVVAVPVGSRQARGLLEEVADEVVCLQTPSPFGAVGIWFRDFGQVGDEEVRRLLAPPAPSGGHDAPEPVRLRVGRVVLAGELAIPERALGLVVFAHGSGSSHRSPRNRAVAAELRRGGLATLLIDLLDEGEAGRRELVFDVDLLASRLVEITRRMRSDDRLAALPVGYFGASTGAAAALVAAAELGPEIAAVVSRGGRPDLAAARLADVMAPTLLIVGSLDGAVLQLNRRAAAALGRPGEVVVVDGATHLFEEPGALERVARLATDWFGRHLAAGRRWPGAVA